MNVALRKTDGSKVGEIATTVDVQRPTTRYLVTPEKGRVGKSREVKPQVVVVETLPHNFNKMGPAIVAAFHKYFKRYDAWVVFDHRASTDNNYVGLLYCSGVEAHLATFNIETIEE